MGKHKLIPAELTQVSAMRVVIGGESRTAQGNSLVGVLVSGQASALEYAAKLAALSAPWLGLQFQLERAAAPCVRQQSRSLLRSPRQRACPCTCHTTAALPEADTLCGQSRYTGCTNTGHGPG